MAKRRRRTSSPTTIKVNKRPRQQTPSPSHAPSSPLSNLPSATPSLPPSSSIASPPSSSPSPNTSKPPPHDPHRHAEKIKKRWGVYPWELCVLNNPRTWTRNLLSQLWTFAQSGCDVHEAKRLIEQAIQDRLALDWYRGCRRGTYIYPVDIRLALESYLESDEGGNSAAAQGGIAEEEGDITQRGDNGEEEEDIEEEDAEEDADEEEDVEGDIDEEEDEEAENNLDEEHSESETSDAAEEDEDEEEEEQDSDEEEEEEEAEQTQLGETSTVIEIGRQTGQLPDNSTIIEYSDPPQDYTTIDTTIADYHLTTILEESREDIIETPLHDLSAHLASIPLPNSSPPFINMAVTKRKRNGNNHHDDKRDGEKEPPASQLTDVELKDLLLERINIRQKLLQDRIDKARRKCEDLKAQHAAAAERVKQEESQLKIINSELKKKEVIIAWQEKEIATLKSLKDPFTTRAEVEDEVEAEAQPPSDSNAETSTNETDPDTDLTPDPDFIASYKGELAQLTRTICGFLRRRNEEVLSWRMQLIDTGHARDDSARRGEVAREALRKVEGELAVSMGEVEKLGGMVEGWKVYARGLAEWPVDGVEGEGEGEGVGDVAGGK